MMALSKQYVGPAWRSRSFADADPRLTEQAESFLTVRLDVTLRNQERNDQELPHVGRPLTAYSFDWNFPFLNSLEEDKKKFLNRSVFDGETLAALERTSVVNWWTANVMESMRPAEQRICKLVALRTRGDGNCLLHAVSLSMWGVDDKALRLRKILYTALTHPAAAWLRNRWRHVAETENQENGFSLDSSQWRAEWQSHVVDLCAPMPRSDGMSYESLSEFHIFTLAQVLQRPIVCFAAATIEGAAGENFAPVNMAGIYLPLAWEPAQCIKSPVMIGFAGGHFVGLVRRDDIGLIPLCKKNDLTRLPVQFLLPKETGVKEKLLDKYLYHSYAQMPASRGTGLFETFKPMDVAGTDVVELPQQLKQLTRAFQDKFDHLYYQDIAARCRAGGCENFHGENSMFCSRCAKTRATLDQPDEQLLSQTTDNAASASIASTTSAAPLAPTAPLLDGRLPDGEQSLLDPRYCDSYQCLNAPDPGLAGLCQECHAQGGLRRALRSRTAARSQSVSATPPVSAGPAPSATTVTTGVSSGVPGEFGRSLSSPSATSGDVGETSAKQCIEPGCMHFGSRNFAGRCSRCNETFKKNSGRDSPPAPSTVHVACKNRACKKAADPASPSGYCPEHREIHEPPRPHSAPVESPEPPRCPEPGCDLFGNPMYDNMCSRCFDSKKSRRQTTEQRTRHLPVCKRTGCEKIALAGSASGFCAEHDEPFKVRPAVPAATPAAAGHRLSDNRQRQSSATSSQTNGNNTPPLDQRTCASPRCRSTTLSAEWPKYCAHCVSDMEKLWQASRRHRHHWTCSTCKNLVDLPQDSCANCIHERRHRRPAGSYRLCGRHPLCNNEFEESLARQCSGFCQPCFSAYGGQTRCRTSGCQFYGSTEDSGYCSSCTDRQKRERIQSQQRAAMRDVRAVTRFDDVPDFSPAPASGAVAAGLVACTQCRRVAAHPARQVCDSCHQRLHRHH